MSETSTSTKKLLSLVVPIYNEEGTIEPFWQRAKPVLVDVEARGWDWEVIFTNNRSTDATLDKVLALRAQEPRIQVLTWSRNAGYQSSLFGGLRQARGDAIFVVDVDCEDPPELLREFLTAFEAGHDLVYGIRGRREEPAPITWARKIFYRLNRLLADSDIVVDMAEFCLMSRDVRDAVTSSVSTFPFLRAEIAHYGFSRKGIPYDRQRRVAGETHYRLPGMVRFAVAGILSSTTAPLRLAAYGLFPVLLVDVLLAGLQLWKRTSLLPIAGLVAVTGGYVACVAAAIALYLARTYRNVIDRPLVVVDWAKSATNAPREQSPNALPQLWKQP